VGHDRNRQWRGEGSHEVELAFAFAFVEQSLDRLIDQLHVTRHPPWGEGRCGEPTDAGVVGWVEFEQ
jgi:hypothetical protein